MGFAIGQKGEMMDDTISRKAAIDALRDEFKRTPTTAIRAMEALNSLPSAQPEIIYCKDCKHFVREDYDEYTPNGFYNTYFSAFCDKHWDKEQGEYIDVKMDDYCSFAERRTDET